MEGCKDDLDGKLSTRFFKTENAIEQTDANGRKLLRNQNGPTGKVEVLDDARFTAWIVEIVAKLREK